MILRIIRPKYSPYQIAATLDKGQPGKNNGRNTFWSITLTHLLSVSTHTGDPRRPLQTDRSRQAHNAQRT